MHLLSGCDSLFFTTFGNFSVYNSNSSYLQRKPYVLIHPPIRNLEPVEQANRIQILDILYGFAIFGILAVNIAGFSSPSFLPRYAPAAKLPWYDALAENLVVCLAESGFYTIFSFLFGLGFAMQLSRAEQKGLVSAMQSVPAPGLRRNWKKKPASAKMCYCLVY